MFQWTEEEVSFREDAARVNLWEEKIAAKILPYLPENAYVCDGGCGLGYLSLFLAEAGCRTAAVDTSPAALAVLRRNRQERHLNNIEIYEEDFFAMKPAEPYDAMVCCFFGSTEEVLRTAAAHCRGKVIMVKKAWDYHRFSLERRPLAGNPFEMACGRLEQLGIAYKTEMLEAEMGQPFRSLAGAERFFRIYEGSRYREGTDISACLVPGTSAEFPLYYPFRGKIGIILLEADDVRKSEAFCTCRL